MLQIKIPETELYDGQNDEFITIGGIALELEHSLLAVNKWESKWHVPLLGSEEKTKEQMLDYIRCMTITPDVNPIIYRFLPNEIYSKIIEYIQDSHTATTINNIANRTNGGKKEKITAEIIYYWMISFGVPMEFEERNLNQLFTLLSVLSIKNSPPKKMGKREAAQWRAEQNALRRAKYGSKG